MSFSWAGLTAPAPRSAFRRLKDSPAQIDADFVVERQRPDRHAGHLGGVLDHRRRHAFHHHRVRFDHVIADAAVDIETAAVVDHDRRLLDRADEIHRDAERLRVGLLAHDDLGQHHLLHRREEVHADEMLRLQRSLGERGDRQRRGVAGEDDVGADDGLRLLRRLLLDRAILEHRLDDEVAALELRIVRGRRDAGEQRLLVGGLGAAFGDLGAHELVRIGLALVGGLLIAVDQHDIEPGITPRHRRCQRPSGPRRARRSCASSSAERWPGDARPC